MGRGVWRILKGSAVPPEGFPIQRGRAVKLGTKLTLYLSLIIILVLSGYGYLDIVTRREILVRKMKAEVRSTGLTLKALAGEGNPCRREGLCPRADRHSEPV